MAQDSNIKINTVFDIYKWYVASMQKKDPGFKTEYDYLSKAKGISILYKVENGVKKVHMTYTWFRAILERNNIKAREAVVNGEVYSLGNTLGYLRARRIERDFSKPKIDIIATRKYREENEQARAEKRKIYHMDEDYCRIAWNKWAVDGMVNRVLYEFRPCPDFRRLFSKANATNMLLKFKYIFFPLYPKNHDS